MLALWKFECESRSDRQEKSAPARKCLMENRGYCASSLTRSLCSGRETAAGAAIFFLWRRSQTGRGCNWKIMEDRGIQMYKSPVTESQGLSTLIRADTCWESDVAI